MSSILEALEVALNSVDPAQADTATVALARRYATDIDTGGDLAKLGPGLLATLTALGMTPAARRQVTQGGAADARPASPLDELRARRAARRRNTPAVDTTTA